MTSENTAEKIEPVQKNEQVALSPALAAKQVISSICDSYKEREEEAKILVLASICEEHVLLLGPPGTGKTSLVVEYSKCLGVSPDSLFVYLMSKTTTPDEIFGPLNFALYEKGVCQRITDRKLPQAEFAVIDECFKANSAILNNMLTIMNERKFDNPNRETVPLETMVGMSNELPEGGVTGELHALYDRFLFRRWVEPVRSQKNFIALMLNSNEPTIAAKLSDIDLDALRFQRDKVNISPILDEICSIKDQLEHDHQIEVSTRRWKKCMKAIRASAALANRSDAEVSDLKVIIDCLWSEPKERPVISNVVLSYADRELVKAQEYYDAVLELLSEFPDAKASDVEFASEAIKVYKKVKDIATLAAQIPSPSREVAHIISRIENVKENMVRAQKSRFDM